MMLLVGEQTIAVLRKHPLVLVFQLCSLTVASLAMLVFLHLVAPRASPLLWTTLLVILLCVLVNALWGWRSAVVVVTDCRIVMEEGVLQRRTRLTPFECVREIILRSSKWGRALDYCSIEVVTMGRSIGEVYCYVGEPAEVVQRLTARLNAVGDRDSFNGGPGEKAHGETSRRSLVEVKVTVAAEAGSDPSIGVVEEVSDADGLAVRWTAMGKAWLGRTWTGGQGWLRRSMIRAWNRLAFLRLWD